MQNEIMKLIDNLKVKLNHTNSLEDVENLRVEYLGKNGLLTKMMPLIKTLPNEEKPQFGKWIN
ncbi:MAG TPA: phenylalanine--tRNA ligase subunit alpha, partial [Acholeplasma sp.]|nr:phenylalanine--tRNA ligase subunit alpha [Acholeplasma sp.]